MSEEAWNSVDVFGPQAEIDRFKALCIVPAPSEERHERTHIIDFGNVVLPPDEPNKPLRPMYCDWDRPSNFRSQAQHELGTYSFTFDTAWEFPTQVFEQLATMFPSLAFHCESIASNDEFMAFGWFNPPTGGEVFATYALAPDYWDTGGPMREPIAELRHQARLAKVKLAARRASEM